MGYILLSDWFMGKIKNTRPKRGRCLLQGSIQAHVLSRAWAGHWVGWQGGPTHIHLVPVLPFSISM